MQQCLLIALAIALLAGGGCSQTGKSLEEEFGYTPAQILAKADGKTSPGDEATYTQGLARLKELCWNSEDDLALMIFGVNRKYQEQGIKSTNLETIKAFISDAEGGFEGKQGNCQEIYKHYQEFWEE